MKKRDFDRPIVFVPLIVLGIASVFGLGWLHENSPEGFRLLELMFNLVVTVMFTGAACLLWWDIRDRLNSPANQYAHTFRMRLWIVLRHPLDLYVVLMSIGVAVFGAILVVRAVVAWIGGHALGD